jgi:hypothetical protein
MIYQPNYQGRLDWASQHLQSLEAEERVWRESNPCRVWAEFDLQSSKYVVFAEAVRPPPTEFALIVGDVLHNLRATLDNLVYELAVAHTGSPLPRSIERASQFPIFRHESDFLSKGKDMVGGIHPDAQALIEGQQPYKRGNENSTLLVLSQLSNTDKHRLPPVAPLAMTDTISFFTTDPRGIPGFEPVWGTVEGRTVIARYSRTTETYTEMEMQQPPTFKIAFGERAPDVIQGWTVVGIMTQIRDFIALDVIPPLMRYLA